ncbi:unnamed protein product [Adineta ricciae]|uniref:Hexosyltransferase n=1 Tax=Adineta ricciae TaxID=249248 RepID=A0A814QV84_ADIRI|nr:unnamed protein product [Adineta ricciae]CAF1441863.1 unnamed protein product [Adineta ricciae]
MPFKQLYVPFLRQYLRFPSLSIKLLLFITIFIFLIGTKQIFSNKTSWCNPEQSLWWFCPWPGPETVCSWDEHFSKANPNNRSPASYHKVLRSLPKRRSSFLFNNLTLTQCNESSLDLLIFIISKCSHGSIRQSIRRTWANQRLLQQFFPDLHIKLLFLLDNDPHSTPKLVLEHQFYQDLVQVTNLPEQYDYVTQRESALYEFVVNRCQQTRFVFKTDDDIFINTILLLSKVQSLTNNAKMKDKTTNKYLMFGFPIEHGLVVRHSADQVGQRYVITKDEYSCPRYPTFLSGFGYLMTVETCSLLFDAYVSDERPFLLSDVYFTGLLAEMMQIPRMKIIENVNYRYESQCNEEFFREKENSALACAASNDHFDVKQSKGGDRSLMNDYNRYWTMLIERHRTSMNSKR